MSRYSDLKVRVARVENDLEYGKFSALKREVEYLTKAKIDQARSIAALCAIAGISQYDLQPITGDEK